MPDKPEDSHEQDSEQRSMNFSAEEYGTIPKFTEFIPITWTTIIDCYNIWSDSDDKISEDTFIQRLIRCGSSAIQLMDNNDEAGQIDKTGIRQMDVPAVETVIDKLLPVVQACRDLWVSDVNSKEERNELILNGFLSVGHKVYADLA